MPNQAASAEHTHFHGGSRPAMEHQLLVKRIAAVGGAIDQDVVIGELDNPVVVKFGKMLRGGWLVGERDGQHKMTARFEQIERMTKCPRYGWRHMLEHFRGDQKVARH